MALMGKSGKDLSDTFNAMANGGLDAAGQKAKALGLAVGEGGVNQSLAMGRAMKDLEMAGQGLAVSLGTTLLPVLVPLIQKFAEWAISVMPQVRDIVTRVGEVIGQLVEGVTKGTGPMGELGSVAQTVFTTIRTVIEDVVKWVTKNWPEIQRVAGAVFAAIDNVIQTVIVPVLAFLAEQFGVVVSWVTENWPLIQATAEKVFAAIKAVIVVVAPVLEQVIGGTFNSIKAVIETVLGTVLGIIKTVMQLINGDWEGAWNTIKGVVEGIWTGIKNFFGGLPDQVLQFGKNIINGLADGIKNSASAVLNALSDVVNNAINSVKATLGIHSPSTVFSGFGENMMRGLADGIDSFGALPTVSVRGVVGGFTGNATTTGGAQSNPFSRGGITISQIIIQASNEAGGRAAARGFAEELTRRGLLPVGV
jgi:phage-related protein